MISFLAAFLDQRRMSEARKAAAAPRGPRDNAAPRAAYSGKSTLRCNTPAKLRPAAQPPSPELASSIISATEHLCRQLSPYLTQAFANGLPTT